MDVKFITAPRSRLNDIQIVNGQLIYLSDEAAAFYDMSNTRYSLSGVTFVNGLPASGSSGLIYVDLSTTPYSLWLWNDTENDFINLSGYYQAGTGLTLNGDTFNHTNSTTAGTASGDADKTLAWDGTFTIPSVTFDAQGHITTTGVTTMTMPSNPNTHWTTRIYAGTGGASHATTTNGNTKIAVTDDGAVRNTISIVGTGDTTVTSNDQGVITVNSSGGGAVSGVKGNAESTYRTGNVNITAANIGLGNVGNFKAVSTVASQGLSDTEKANARTNIGAGTGSVTGVKGNSESTYRTGNVNITKANIGLGNVPNPTIVTGTLAAGNNTITFTNAAITTNSTLSLYCSDSTASYEEATVSAGSATFSGFDAPSAAISMKLYVF